MGLQMQTLSLRHAEFCRAPSCTHVVDDSCSLGVRGDCLPLRSANFSIAPLFTPFSTPFAPSPLVQELAAWLNLRSFTRPMYVHEALQRAAFNQVDKWGRGHVMSCFFLVLCKRVDLGAKDRNRCLISACSLALAHTHAGVCRCVEWGKGISFQLLSLPSP